MMEEIRIYVEGGGDGADTKARFRQGFQAFLKELVDAARTKRIRWSVIACGSRDSTFEDFKTALRAHPHAFNVLLVDAEDPVISAPLRHLQERDGWDVSGVQDEQCHLMVQMMESWFLADVDALSNYYGQGFNAGALSKNTNVEVIDKRTVESSLKAATNKTQKGSYHKTRHGSQILMRLSARKVRDVSPHCERLFKIIFQKMT